MSNNILFIFEGERTEYQITTNLQKFFVNENTIIKCAFCGEIYQLYQQISEDEDLDTFSLIKARSRTNRDLLQNYTRDDFAEIYMFFDYEGHSSIADDEHLEKLLNFFNEETDKGKLYISYPMVEALKHVAEHDTFKNLEVRCKENIRYKNMVNEECRKELQQFSKYTFDVWARLIDIHLRKMNYIVNDLFEFPIEIVSQSVIFARQLEKYINKEYPVVGVLSAFPIFLHDYYGNEFIKEKIRNL